MKIRISGAKDLVERWSTQMTRLYGITGRIYPDQGEPGVRWYGDIDDRRAEELAQVFGPDPNDPEDGEVTFEDLEKLLEDSQERSKP